MNYQTKPRLVYAWQHTQANREALEGEDTSEVPAFLLTLLSTGMLTPVPDGSLHLTTNDGRVMPVPVNYWIVYGRVDHEVDSVAPDVFNNMYLDLGPDTPGEGDAVVDEDS